VKVSWENDVNSNKSVTMATDFAPPGVEGNISGGTLIIKVLDKDSQGIPDFNVHVVNHDLSIDEHFVTDSNGGVSLPGIPVDGNDYEILVSKDDYFSISTLPAYPESSFLPVYVHASVTDGARNIFSIITDYVSEINLSTKDPFGNPVPDIAYHLAGGLRLGDTIDDPPDNPTEPIFYYDEDLDSGSEAKNEIQNVSFGDYTFNYADSGGNYEFMKMSPANATVNDSKMFFVEPGSDVDETAVFASKNMNSTLLTVLDSVDDSPIEGASARVYNSSLPIPYDETVATDKFGMAYFPANLPELTAGDYNIEVQKDGYVTKTAAENVTGYVKKEILMDLN